ncbi:MAG TPA: phenylacetate--CoA ligase [Firmicutes bacterium]|nr:phenylacetate--CoA ligase [Bacillota bacterium]
MMWQKDLETMSRKDIEALQLERLRFIVDYADKRVPFYHKKLEELGVTAEKIKTLSDVKYLPMTTKTDLRDHYPYGFFAVPMREIVRLHASSGTTGKPIVGGYTRNDLNNWADCVARVCTAAGITDEDIVQISFGYGMFTGALGLHYGLEKIGATVVPASSGNTERQLMMLQDFGVTGLVSTPSYAIYMSEVAREKGMDGFKLKTGLFGSEGCTPEMRTKIEENFHLFATDNYGLTELGGPGVAGECEYRCGLHIAEDHYLAEIIDPDTLEPKAPGETGELVITTLTKEGVPMIRYRTKDISRIHYEPCRCGRTHARMEKVMGRTDDMLIIKGVNVFPSQIESVLMTIPNIGAHYQLIITRSSKFMDNLEVKVELINGDLLERYKELEQLREDIRAQLRSTLRLDVKVTLVEPKTLQRFEGKAKRILDLRNEH